VGREREAEEVRDLLTRRDVRLLTLTGIGGVGKTRLAMEVAQEVAENFPDGAAFVGLASLGDPALVVPTVSRSLGVPEAEGRTPTEALVDHLRDKSLLLVLDNLEHLLQAAPEVAALLDACGGLVVLATSRAPLRIRGERSTLYLLSRFPSPPALRPRKRSSPRLLGGSSWSEPGPPPSALLSPMRTQRRWRPSAGGWPGCRWRWSWQRRRRGS
jgi:Cdc6-like AAA superfamily ATPase